MSKKDFFNPILNYNYLPFIIIAIYSFKIKVFHLSQFVI